MGIYLPNMEMPSFGNETIIRIQSGGGVLDQYGHHLACTAIPVPPHGDLVDRDETIEAGKSHPTYKNSKIVKAVVDKACCLLKTATVVIPANKEE